MAPKRMLESGEPESDDGVVVSSAARDKRPRVPRFADVMMGALRMQNLQTFLEPLLRRVVGEEIDRAFERRIPAKIMSAAKQIQGSGSRNLRLQFSNRLSLPLFTGSRVEGDQGSSIQIFLLDASTKRRITSGPESLQKVEIVVLEGDFGHDDNEEWTEAEFDNYVVREREGKRPLLTGELIVSLKDGVGSLGELYFTDNSSWIRSRKFRLGARVAGGNYNGIRIREAKSEAFTVKDHRGELYKKHYPPALDDEVWRLDRVGKDGAFHKRLSNEGIKTVQEFLRVLVTDSQRLRLLLGNGMSNKMWEGTVEHAKTCVLNNRRYVYHSDRQNNLSVIFNTIYEPVAIITEGQIVPLDELSEKTFVEKLVKSAYGHWDQVIEYEEGFPISNASHSLALKNTHIEASEVHGGPSYQRTVLASEQDGQGSHMMGSRFMGNQQSIKHATGDWLHSDGSVNMAASNQVSIVAGFVQQSMATQPMESPSLALGPRQTHMYPLPLPYHSTNLNSFMYRNGPRNQHAEKGLRDVNRNDWTSESHEGPSSFFHTNSSNEMVTNCRGPDAEDLQDWIPIINGGTAEQGYNFFPNTPGDQIFGYSNFSTVGNMSFDMSRDRLHGKAYLGWLKIKAALKWGISVRKVAAARRAAKLEELDD